MEVFYQFIAEDGLLIQKFSGNFSVPFYMNYMRSVMSTMDPKAVKRVLNDFRDMRFSESPDIVPADFTENMNRMISVRKEIVKTELKQSDFTLVIWVDKPIPTAIAHLFVASFPEKSYHYCSSVKEVRKHLLLPERYNDLENLVEHLSNRYAEQEYPSQFSA
jgi:hypothetical protein